MSEETKDNFEKGIFWELYKDLERQFQDFLEYVPYLLGNEAIYSFKLLNLILSVGGHIDSAFKEMARYPGFSDNDDCKQILDLLKESDENIKEGKAPKTVPMWLSLRAFEKEYHLTNKKVIFKRSPEREQIMPFKPYNPKTNAPKWWEIYNALKHDASVNIREANLHTTLDALAGAFLLNVIHIPGCLRLMEDRVVKRTNGGYFRLPQGWRERVKDLIEKKKRFGVVETPLFIYNYAEKE